VTLIKKFFWFFLAMSLAGEAGAQSNASIRLALIAETTDASAPVDVLTAEFSQNGQINLLERNEIEKVYREQALSSANQDYLKLGQVLGADGLLLIRAKRVISASPAIGAGFAAKQKPEFDLSVQLIAVKPGVSPRG
jgi:hypothetical protein